MPAVRIQVINPNTSLAMTETIGTAARAVAAPGTEILAVCPSAGVPLRGILMRRLLPLACWSKSKPVVSRAWMAT